MKRAKQLFDRIPERNNLLLAVQRALRGKRSKADAIDYIANMDENLNTLAGQIRCGDVATGAAIQFTIYDPKERLITAPCFSERVMHHAIMNVCEPAFEQRLIHHSYACRVGKGQFAALDAAATFARKHTWFLKMDVRKYFDSIPKAQLVTGLQRVFAEPRVVRLFTAVLHGHQPGQDRGLPIGSLISQHCANFYLNTVDRHVTQKEGLGAYVRYMDDFVVWSQDKGRLVELGEILRGVLASIGLQFKATPWLNRTTHGMDFLGHRVYHDRVTLNRRSRVRFTQRIRSVMADWAAGVIPEIDAQKRSVALCAFTQHFSDASFRNRGMEDSGGVPMGPTA
jgi:RNA-directed DNA polymerase